MNEDTRYEPPKLERLGSIEEVTQGKFHSRVDGNSGGSGNRGNGWGGR